MSTNYYKQLLNINSTHSSPLPHELLGLPAEGVSADKINQAARIQIKKLDRYSLHQDHEIVDASQHIMNEIAQARNSMLASLPQASTTESPTPSKSKASSEPASISQAEQVLKKSRPESNKKTAGVNSTTAPQKPKPSQPRPLHPAIKQTLLWSSLALGVIVLASAAITLTLYFGTSDYHSDTDRDQSSPPRETAEIEAYNRTDPKFNAPDLEKQWNELLTLNQDLNLEEQLKNTLSFLEKYPDHAAALLKQKALEKERYKATLWATYEEHQEKDAQLAVNALVELIDDYPEEKRALPLWHALRLQVPESTREAEQRREHLQIITDLHQAKKLKDEDFQRAQALLQKDPRQLNKRDQAMARATWYLAEGAWSVKAYLASIINIQKAHPQPTKTASSSTTKTQAQSTDNIVDKNKRSPSIPSSTGRPDVRKVTHSALLKEVQSLRKKKKWDEALAKLDEIILLEPTHREAWKAYGTIVDLRNGRKRKSITNSIGMKLLEIPPARFLMGSPENEPGRDADETQRPVTLTKKIYMAQMEVTVKDWKAVMYFGQRSTHSSNRGVLDDQAMSYVSWDEAREFCRRLSQIEGRLYRLPTEAEWEYVSRAGGLSAFSPSKDYNLQLSMSHAGPFTRSIPRPDTSINGVNNRWGFRQINGNVWEWVHDSYAAYPSGPVIDPLNSNDTSWKVLRGGSFTSLFHECRSANRHRAQRDTQELNIGFRVVLEPDTPVRLEAPGPTKSNALERRHQKPNLDQPDSFQIPETMKAFVVKADHQQIVLRQEPTALEQQHRTKIHVLIDDQLLTFDFLAMRSWITPLKAPSALHHRFHLTYRHGWIWWAENGTPNQASAPYLEKHTKGMHRFQAPYAVSSRMNGFVHYKDQIYTYDNSGIKKTVKSSATGRPTQIMDSSGFTFCHVYQDDKSYSIYLHNPIHKLAPQQHKLSPQIIPLHWKIVKIKAFHVNGKNSGHIFIVAEDTNKQRSTYVLSLSDASLERWSGADDVHKSHSKNMVILTEGNQATVILRNDLAKDRTINRNMPQGLPINLQALELNYGWTRELGGDKTYVVLGSQNPDQQGHYHLSIQEAYANQSQPRQGHTQTNEKQPKPVKVKALAPDKPELKIPEQAARYILKADHQSISFYQEPHAVTIGKGRDAYILTQGGLIHYAPDQGKIDWTTLSGLGHYPNTLKLTSEGDLLIYNYSDFANIYIYRKGKLKRFGEKGHHYFQPDGNLFVTALGNHIALRDLEKNGRPLAKAITLPNASEEMVKLKSIGPIAVIHDNIRGRFTLLNFSKSQKTPLSPLIPSRNLYQFDLAKHNNSLFLVTVVDTYRDSTQRTHIQQLGTKKVWTLKETRPFQLIRQGQAIAFLNERTAHVYEMSNPNQKLEYSVTQGVLYMIHQNEKHTALLIEDEEGDASYVLELQPNK